MRLIDKIKDFLINYHLEIPTTKEKLLVIELHINQRKTSYDCYYMYENICTITYKYYNK